MASSSTSPAQALVIPLRRDSSTDEYDSWKSAVLSLLESRNLEGIVDGTIPLPPETNSEAYADWRDADEKIREWILSLVSVEVAHVVSFAGVGTARSVWLHLENWFTQSNGSVTPPPAALQGEDWNNYLALYKAALRGDWSTVRGILDIDPNAATARVSSTLDTALHIAVGTGKAIPFVENLVNEMPVESLALKNELGYTALHVAATIGNLAAAKILVGRSRGLLYVPANWKVLPVVNAVLSGHRDTIEFLISETRDDVEPYPYADDNGVLLLTSLIQYNFFDIALRLIERFPDLAKKKHTSGHSALRTLAEKDGAFASGTRFNFWERLIYNSIPPEMASETQNVTPKSFDIENPSCSALVCGETLRHPGFQTIQTILFGVIEGLVPHTKRIREQKFMHQQALKLAERLCEEMRKLSAKDAASIYRNAVFKTAELGTHEVLEVIVETFPAAIYSVDGNTNMFFIHMAVQNRCEKVFNLIYQMSDNKVHFPGCKDTSGNTALHLVASLAPHHKLNLVSGAALQMQRELQWFKEVEKFMRPSAREFTNIAGKTAKMIFTEEHKSLKIEGEKWMKDTANSCTITAALIATVVFAAAITVPGGNAGNGYPMFSRSSAFVIFAVSDAVSLFTSTTSLLIFLSILTSRYAEEDFLHALPKRLCVGLLTLFLSILSMTAAFSATLFLVFGRQKSWVLMPVAALASLPIASFVLLQFPLLVDVISSTYGRGIFAKQSNRPFY